MRQVSPSFVPGAEPAAPRDRRRALAEAERPVYRTGSVRGIVRRKGLDVAPLLALLSELTDLQAELSDVLRIKLSAVRRGAVGSRGDGRSGGGSSAWPARAALLLDRIARFDAARRADIETLRRHLGAAGASAGFAAETVATQRQAAAAPAGRATTDAPRNVSPGRRTGVQKW